MKETSFLKIRTCLDCKHSDFAETLNRVGVRHYRHAPEWKARCEWFKDHPDASLSEAKASDINGVSHI